MPVEIERKFLVKSDAWRAGAHAAEDMSQGYLANTSASSVRVRIAGEQGHLSVKAMTPGRVRAEYDYAIPLADAREMLGRLCVGPLVEKTRHHVAAGRHVFEIDEFHGANEGLVVAELELDDPDEEFERPLWLGDEVTDQLRYYNFRLAHEPFSGWPDAARRGCAVGRHVSGEPGETRG